MSCDVTQHLVALWTAVETQTNSSGMCTHAGQHSTPTLHADTNFVNGTEMGTEGDRTGLNS